MSQKLNEGGKLLVYHDTLKMFKRKMLAWVWVCVCSKFRGIQQRRIAAVKWSKNLVDQIPKMWRYFRHKIKIHFVYTSVYYMCSTWSKGQQKEWRKRHIMRVYIRLKKNVLKKKKAYTPKCISRYTTAHDIPWFSIAFRNPKLGVA